MDQFADLSPADQTRALDGLVMLIRATKSRDAVLRLEALAFIRQTFTAEMNEACLGLLRQRSDLSTADSSS